MVLPLTARRVGARGTATGASRARDEDRDAKDVHDRGGGDETSSGSHRVGGDAGVPEAMEAVQAQPSGAGAGHAAAEEARTQLGGDCLSRRTGVEERRERREARQGKRQEILQERQGTFN